MGDNLVRWNELVAKIAFVQLDNQNDSINWVLSKQGAFFGKVYVQSSEPNISTFEQNFMEVEITTKKQDF